MTSSGGPGDLLVERQDLVLGVVELGVDLGLLVVQIACDRGRPAHQPHAERGAEQQCYCSRADVAS